MWKILSNEGERVSFHLVEAVVMWPFVKERKRRKRTEEGGRQTHRLLCSTPKADRENKGGVQYLRFLGTSHEKTSRPK